MKQYKSILVTGGAGFIGSFLVDELISQHYKVRILDNLDDQVHQGKTPSYLNPKADFIRGDVRHVETFRKALKDIDAVFHLASKVGVGQSNYLIKEYMDVNVGGMTNLLDIVVNTKSSVRKIIMTASMTSYGEGMYKCRNCGKVKPSLRKKSQITKSNWEPQCPNCGKPLKPIPTQESALLANNSIYSLSKYMQEQMLLHVGDVYNLPVVSLRCFNVYGPRQSLSNRYTGGSAIFISRLMHNHEPVVYEDGLQTRDFISVYDVVRALIASLKSSQANSMSINIGSGTPTSIKDIAAITAGLLQKDLKPRITYTFRKNDIRHCFADITRAKKVLMWKPKVSLSQGLKELIEWSYTQTSQDLFSKAEKELQKKSLI